WFRDDASKFSWIDSALVMKSEDACAQWLSAAIKYGIAFLKRVPSESDQVLRIADRVGYVVETNYGRAFDVRSRPNPINLADTERRLGLHTDNPYRDPVPGFQMLHCLQAGHQGGESIFADGFAIAQCLADEDREAYSTLTRTPVQFAFTSQDAEL